MTDPNNAAHTAEQDPLSDQFVNAVIRQHGYDSPEAVIARLWQWIGLNGSENGVTLLMYEAHKALSKLRAPVAGEAQADLAPPKCPITGRPFFMALEHPELGMVPTYGGPYDSYTIPHLGGRPDQPRHERELRVYRYDHDLGGWITDETEVIPLRIVHEDVLHGPEDAAPQAGEAVRDALMAFDEAMRLCDDFPELQHHRDALLFAVQKARAALSAQPGAQKERSDA